MIAVDRIIIRPVKTPEAVEATPPRMFKTFQGANEYIYDLKMLTFKGQHTTVEYKVEWVVSGCIVEVKGSFTLEFKHVGMEISLIDLVMRKLVYQVEQHTNVNAGFILKRCKVGDQPCEQAK